VVFELRDGDVSKFEVNAADFGIPASTVADIRGGDAAENLVIMNDLFAGKTGAVRDIVSFNAGCALYIAGLVGEVSEGIDRARASIDSGAAAAALASVVTVTTQQAVRMAV
jgi:anthranilate phosphoribosyltransferase